MSFHKLKFLHIRNNSFIFMQCQSTITQTHMNILCTTREVKIKVYMRILVIPKFLKKMQKTFHIHNKCVCIKQRTSIKIETFYKQHTAIQKQCSLSFSTTQIILTINQKIIRNGQNILIKIPIQTSDNLTANSRGCFATRKYIHLFLFESTSVQRVSD